MTSCVWCGETFTNKISLANHFDNVHKHKKITDEDVDRVLKELDEVPNNGHYFWYQHISWRHPIKRIRLRRYLKKLLETK